MKTSWRRLSSCLQKTSSRRPDEDEYILINHTSSGDVFKTSLRRLGQDQYIRLGHTSSICLEGVLKTSSRRLQDIFKTSSRLFKDVFKRSSRCIRSVFKTSWKTSSRHVREVFKTFQRRLQDIFKTYHQVTLFLLTRLRETFNAFLRHSFPKTVIYSGICLGKTTSDNFKVSVENLQER